MGDDKYEFGYNGQMKTNEIAGMGNHNTALFWEYDTRTGRRWNRDPKMNVWESPYAVFGSNPIWHNDVLGDVWYKGKDGGAHYEAHALGRKAREANGYTERLPNSFMGRGSKGGSSVYTANGDVYTNGGELAPVYVGRKGGMSQSEHNDFVHRRDMGDAFERAAKGGYSPSMGSRYTFAFYAVLFAPIAAIGAVETAPVWMPVAKTAFALKAEVNFASAGSDFISQMATSTGSLSNRLNQWNPVSTAAAGMIGNPFMSSIPGGFIDLSRQATMSGTVIKPLNANTITSIGWNTLGNLFGDHIGAKTLSKVGAGTGEKFFGEYFGQQAGDIPSSVLDKKTNNDGQ